MHQRKWITPDEKTRGGGFFLPLFFSLKIEKQFFPAGAEIRIDKTRTAHEEK
jgi:hypothetical protein